MIGLTHLGFAYFLLRLFQEAGTFGYQGILGLGCLFTGALLPDIDSPFSLLGRLVQPLSFEIWEEFGHRSVTHSLFALGHILLVYLLSFNRLVLMVLIGYASHLLIDLLSKSGVGLLFPLDVELVILLDEVEYMPKRAQEFAKKLRRAGFTVVAAGTEKPEKLEFKEEIELEPLSKEQAKKLVVKLLSQEFKKPQRN